jgi:hypothetical protein
VAPNCNTSYRGSKMVAKVSISVADGALLAWAKERAEREGVSLSAVFTDAVRRARQRDARLRVEEWLGSAGMLTPAREAEIRTELGEDAPAPVAKKQARRRRKR